MRTLVDLDLMFYILSKCLQLFKHLGLMNTIIKKSL